MANHKSERSTYARPMDNSYITVTDLKIPDNELLLHDLPITYLLLSITSNTQFKFILLLLAFESRNVTERYNCEYESTSRPTVRSSI